MNTQDIIEQTQCWINAVIIGLNFCPFAKREFVKQSINYQVSYETSLEENLNQLAAALAQLDSQPEIETTLLICADAFHSFDDFLQLIDYADQLIDELGYRSVYQIAHFHPDYCFQGEPENDPANYTNRSPYPTLHLLRESSLERAINNYPDTASIPENNITLARKLGSEHLKTLLEQCKSSHR